MQTYKNYTVAWDEVNQVVRLSGSGPVDEDVCRWLLEQTDALFTDVGHSVNWLADLHAIPVPTASARKLIVQHQQHPSIHKYAMVGASTLLRTVANFLTAASGVKNARHFATENEALIWLGEP